MSLKRDSRDRELKWSPVAGPPHHPGLRDGLGATVNMAFGPWDTLFVQVRGVPEVGYVGEVGACPPSVSCDTTKAEIQCEGLTKMDSVPQIVNTAATSILISDCALAKLTRRDFEGLSKLVLLTIKSTPLEVLPDSFCADCQSLETLDISYKKGVFV